MDTKHIHLLSPCKDYGHLSTSLDRQDRVFDTSDMLNTVNADYHTGILVGQCIQNRLDIQEWIKCLCCLPCITTKSEKCRKQVRSHLKNLKPVWREFFICNAKQYHAQ